MAEEIDHWPSAVPERDELTGEGGGEIHCNWIKYTKKGKSLLLLFKDISVIPSLLFSFTLSPFSLITLIFSLWLKKKRKNWTGNIVDTDANKLGWKNKWKKKSNLSVCLASPLSFSRPSGAKTKKQKTNNNSYTWTWSGC
jgi:hypothetical protein